MQKNTEITGEEEEELELGYREFKIFLNDMR